MHDVLQDVPYRDEGPGRRKLVDEDHLLVMQVALRPGQEVPSHEANSNVHLLVLRGEVTVELADAETVAGEGALIPVAHRTPMRITNRGARDATFLVWKTPHPSRVEQGREAGPGGS